MTTIKPTEKVNWQQLNQQNEQNNLKHWIKHFHTQHLNTNIWTPTFEHQHLNTNIWKPTFKHQHLHTKKNALEKKRIIKKNTHTKKKLSLKLNYFAILRTYKKWNQKIYKKFILKKNALCFSLGGSYFAGSIGGW